MNLHVPGRTITCTATDGHSLTAYMAGTPDAPNAIVLAHEIFGLNRHIRALADSIAADGFHVIAPALFDRAMPGVELGYDARGIQRGLELRAAIDPADTLADLQASAAAIGRPRIGIVGFCWGGTLAWEAAIRSQRFAAAIGWYGAGIAKSADARPACPVQLHFGADDHSIPRADIDLIRTRQPDIDIHVYENAGHGFRCEERDTHDPKSASLATERTIAFLRRYA